MGKIYLTYLLISIVPLFLYKFPRMGAFLGFLLCALVSLVCGGGYFLLNLEIQTSLNLGEAFLFSPEFRLGEIENFFSALVCILAFICSIFSLKYSEIYKDKANLSVFAALFNAFILSMLLVISANNIFGFLLLWEIMTLISAFFVMIDDQKQSPKVVMTYLGIAQIGAFCIVCALVILSNFSNSMLINEIANQSLPPHINLVVFLLFFIGFGSKAGLWPFHVWQPLTYSLVPSNISAIMSGLMSKVVIFLFIKFSFLLHITSAFSYIVLIFAALTTIIGVAYSVIQNNAKVAVAYSSTENMGIIFLGVGAFFYGISTNSASISALGFIAALYHIINHAMFKSLLFMGLGAMYHSIRSYDMDSLGGLGKKMPKIALLFLIGAMAVSALPPLNGFVSEWVLYKSLLFGGMDSSVSARFIFIFAIVMLSLAGILAVMGFSKIYGAIFCGASRDKEKLEKAKDSDIFMTSAIGILAISCIVFGVFMQEILHFILFLGAKFTNSASFKFDEISMISIPFVILLLLFVTILPAVLTAILKANNQKPRITEPWAGGFIYNPNMQIASNPFSGDLKKALKFLYRTKREFKSGDYFSGGEYKSTTREIWWEFLYAPVVKFHIIIADKIGIFQNGRANFYTAYILFYLCLMLIFGYYFG